MTAKKQELVNMIETLPEEFSSKVIDYVEYLKFTSIINNSPSDLIIKNKQDLREKIEEGIKDTENGKSCSLDEVFTEIEATLLN